MLRVDIKLYSKRTGGFSARKRIPKDVRSEYSRLHGKSSEEWFSTGPVGLAEAKRKVQEWSAEIETRIANIRATRTGDGQSLSRKQALALAGEWYKWFVGPLEDDPGDPKLWEARRSNFWADLEDFAPEAVWAGRVSVWEWAQSDEARPVVRPIVADTAKTAQFLASRGLTLTNESRDTFLDAVLVNFVEALTVIQRRAKGDYGEDTWPTRFPKFTLAKSTVSSELTPWHLFEAWVNSSKPAPATVTRWRAVFLEMQRHFEGRTANSLTEDEVRDWLEKLISPTRTAVTVSDVWLIAARTVFAWALQQKKIQTNPFAKVKITVPKKTLIRETKAFRPEEIQTILSAALAIGGDEPQSAFTAACRWVPWICAYTGARAGEITQLRGKDVERYGSVYAIRITPEAGTVKTSRARLVPLHEHLVKQGFAEFARAAGSGPLFYSSAPARKTTNDPTKPVRSRAVKTRERLADWVRKLGVNDPEISPNHGWRHTFKLIADRHGITERMSDYITGHKQLTVGRGYGAPTLHDMADELKKFPRYEIATKEDA
jgi:integrase